MNSKWKLRLPDIQLMLNEGFSDKDIARHFNDEARVVYQVIRRYGLVRPDPVKPDPTLPRPVPIIATYQEGKHTVKVGEPRYGCALQSDKVKPRSRH